MFLHFTEARRRGMVVKLVLKYHTIILTKATEASLLNNDDGKLLYSYRQTHKKF